MLLEISVYNLEAAKIAEAAGADRLEICENYNVGGLTPSYKILEEIVKKITIPVFPIIRPRAGNFVYSQNEFNIMQNDILHCKTLGFAGVVFGILDENNCIDFEKMKLLVKLAQPMQVTFHKAFDEIENSNEAVKQLIEIGCKRILSSGKANTAIEGKKILSQLQEKYKNEITFIVAGTVRYNNIQQLIDENIFTEFHSAALKITNENFLPDGEEIKNMKQLLQVNR